MAQVSLARRLRTMQGMGIFSAHTMVKGGCNNVAIAQVAREMPEGIQPKWADVVSKLEPDAVIIAGDTEGNPSKSVFEMGPMEKSSVRLFAPLKYVYAIGPGRAKKIFTADATPIMYAATTERFDPSAGLCGDDIKQAQDAIAAALYLSGLVRHPRVLLGARIFCEGQIINPYDEARMVVRGVEKIEMESAELVVLTTNDAEQGAYTYVFQQIADGNYDILDEPNTSFGFSI